MCTLNPVTFRTSRSSSPVWTPQRTSIPASVASRQIVSAHRTALLGPSNTLIVPSPVTLTSSPPLVSTASRTSRSCEERISRYRASPTRASSSVEETTSVKSTLPRNRSASAEWTVPVATSSMWSATGR